MKSFDTYVLESGLTLKYWSQDRLRNEWQSGVGNLLTIANACRLNILSSIKAAGSGHIGASFSSIDLILAAHEFLDTNPEFPFNYESGGIFFSSKGHDAPAIYAAMHFIGEIRDDELFTLRRLNGLPGHPEVFTPGIPTNTGSLGMGISKGKGFVAARRLLGKEGKVIVLLGDGELQEGQIWEALPTAARDSMHELVVIVDGNKIQSDTWTGSVAPFNDLSKRVEGCGWNYTECNGHDINDIRNALNETNASSRPTFIYANTFKGAGVSFMSEFSESGKFYKFHSGSISDELYDSACSELLFRISNNLTAVENLANFNYGSKLTSQAGVEIEPFLPKSRPMSLINVWAELLLEFMSDDSKIIALDADLSYDTGTYATREFFPARYIQCGISEQDMVSMAGTLALSGFLPIVHSFATFLTMRPTEQIFNNATELTQILYLGFLAGLIPSPPGFSHQAVNDVEIMTSIPGMRIVEPACESEMRAGVLLAKQSQGPTYMRVGSVGVLPSAQEFPSGIGELTLRKTGKDIAIVTSGPTLTIESLACAKLLEEKGISCAVFTYPFITSDPTSRTLARLKEFQSVFIVENFNSARATYFRISRGLLASRNINIRRFGLEGIPASGWNHEVLQASELDATSLAKRIVEDLI